MLYQLSYLAAPGKCSRVPPISPGWITEERLGRSRALPGGREARGKARSGVKEGAHGGTRVHSVLDTTVFSRVLYQLSYLAARSSSRRLGV